MMDIQKFEARLQAEKATLEAELAAHGRQTANTHDWQGAAPAESAEADPNVAADNIEELATNVSVVEELETRYHNVLAALAKIDAGTYGVCAVGGEAIAEERLEANPAANTCTEHA